MLSTSKCRLHMLFVFIFLRVFFAGSATIGKFQYSDSVGLVYTTFAQRDALLASLLDNFKTTFGIIPILYETLSFSTDMDFSKRGLYWPENFVCQRICCLQRNTSHLQNFWPDNTANGHQPHPQRVHGSYQKRQPPRH